MTVRTRAQLLSDADTYLTTNGAGEITGAILNQRVKDLADSALLPEDLDAEVSALAGLNLQRRNQLLALCDNAKAQAEYRRYLDTLALGFKALGDADATSSGGTVDTSAGAWKPSPAFAGVTFNGSSSYLNRGGDLTSNADGKKGIFSCWLNLSGGNGSALYLITSASGYFAVSRDSSNKIYVRGFNAATTQILNMVSSNSYTSSSGWVHILASWDLATTTGQLYINDASDLAGGSTLTNDNIDYTRTDWQIGALGGASFLTGSLAEMYFNPAESLDISNSTNRRKFISVTGKAVSLGSDGSSPTGTAPKVYLGGNVAASWKTNKGTGGGFTENGAALTAASSALPSPAGDGVLITPYQTADAARTKARAIVEIDPVDSIALGTDFTIEVTCNGGTNWAVASTLTNCGKGSKLGSGNLTVVETEEVTCTSGTSFAARIKNLNGKQVDTYKSAVKVAA